MKKRFLSMLLAVAMALTIVPSTAIAMAVEPETSPAQQSLDAGKTNGQDLQIMSDRIDYAPAVTSADVDLMSSSFGLADGTLDKISGTDEKWINRYNLESYADTFYEVLEEGAAKDGILVADSSYDLISSATTLIDVGAQNWSSVVPGQLSQLKAGNVVRVKQEGVTYSAIFVTSCVANDFGYVSKNISAAYYAFDRDHPEVFWLEGGVSSRAVAINGVYYVFFVLKDNASPAFDLRSSKYQTAEAINATIEARNTVVSKITASIKTLPAAADKIRQLNKVLVDKNDYNQAAVSSAGTVATEGNLPWECLSALKAGTSVEPVCEGYARAFKVLCDQLGIPCVLVDGQAESYPGQGQKGPHMWNYVQMEDDKWYAVDVTWNDPTGGSQTPEMQSKWLLLGSSTPVNEKNDTFISTHPVSNAPTEDAALTYENGPELSLERYVPMNPLPEDATVRITDAQDKDFPYNSFDVGTKLKAQPESFPTDATPAYQWYRNGEPICGVSDANEQIYTVDTADSAATLTVGVSDSSGTYSGEIRSSNQIEVKTVLTDAMVQMTGIPFTYNKTPQTPKITVTAGDQALTQGNDYTIDYKGDENGTTTANTTNVGTVWVFITGQGSYTGTVKKSYSIEKATPTLGTVSVEESLTIYANTLVSTIEANLKSSNENLPAGTWKLNGAGQRIMETGDYSCTFTPTDTHNYTSATGTVHITVTERAVASIEINTQPTKLTYKYGEKFDPAGLVLSVTYNDSTTPEKLAWSENSGITFTPEGDLGDVGSKNITISYGGKSTTTPVSVTVTAKTLDLSKVEWNVATENYTYNGKEHTGATLTGEIPSELVEKERSGDKGTNAGEYTPSVTFDSK